MSKMHSFLSGGSHHNFDLSSERQNITSKTPAKPRRFIRIFFPVSLFIFVALLSSLFTLFPSHHSARAVAAVSFPDQTRVGIHNAYDKSRFTYLINALQSGTGLVEIDVWQNWLLSGQYWVSDNSLGNNNNCENATSYSQLASLNRNQSFSSCLNDIALWQKQFPNHAPLILKLELKNGFDTFSGFGPARLDSMLKQSLGANTIYTPSNLLGSYANLDAAARANAWPAASQLTGKIIVVIQAGAFELRVKSYTSDQEYIDYLISLKNAGNFSQATAFPALLSASSTDPRPSNSHAPWYISFGQDATNWSVIDTSFYYNNHYLVIMTNTQSLTPTVDDLAPAQTDAFNRVNQLAAHAATIASVDWTSPTFLSYTTARSHLSYEAEASTNTFNGGSSVQPCTGCSGAFAAGFVGNGGTLQFNAISAPSSANYTLTIWFTNGDTVTRTASLSVNGAAPITLSFVPTASFQVVDVVSTTIPLNSGNNILLFSNSTGWTPNFDGISIQ